MPLTEKGQKILAAFKSEYGEKKGEEYFYAARNKGSISGIDSADAAPRGVTRFYEDRQLSPHRALTHEGFMICRDVAIARTGRYIYSRDELPALTPSRDGIIYVERTADAVFDDDSMRSFEGKAVTIDHPPVDVTPDNWHEYSVGTVFNVRRGEGAMSDSLMADLFLTDAAAIRMVRANDKTELSCGYDAQYDQVEPGRGRQSKIIGNHVAIVDNGRCGIACRIGDHAMTTLSWADKLRQAFKTRSTDEFEKALEEKEKSEGGGEGGAAKEGAAGASKEGAGGASKEGAIGKEKPGDGEGAGGKEKPEGGESGGGVHHHITVNVGGQGAGAEGAGANGAAGGANGAGAGAEGAGEAADPISIIVDAITALGARMDAIEAKVNGGGNGGDDAAAQAAAAAAGGQTGTEGGGQTQDKTTDAKKTTDAATKMVADLTAEFTEARSLAEILMPGIKPPTLTLDAKSDPTKTRDTICAFRRRAMAEAFEDSKTAPLFEGLVATKDEFKSMTCDAAKLMFKVVSGKARDANNNSMRETGGTQRGNGGIRSIADINARNRAFHADHQ